MTYNEYKVSLSRLMREKSGTKEYRDEFNTLFSTYVACKHIPEFIEGDDVKCDMRGEFDKISNLMATFKKFRVDVRSGELIPVVWFHDKSECKYNMKLIGMTNKRTNERFTPSCECDIFDMKRW